MSVNYVEVIPDPSRVIEGLRDTGYSPETAIEDIIDNSISAGASKIKVNLRMDLSGEVSVSIIDNGCGMNEEELKNAMKYGSRLRPDPASLGKFGLGMKTASTAFARKLVVVSRGESSKDYMKAYWDLDHVVKEKKWELALEEPSNEEIELIREVSGDGSGTLVVWEKVDRLLKTYQDPVGNAKRKALDRVTSDLRDHVAMVYQRFLDPDDKRCKTVLIEINSKKLEAWDPFLSDISTPASNHIDMAVQDEDGKELGKFSVQAFIIPRKNDIQNEELKNKAKISNENQGLYIYRENRLIHGPSWLKMFSQEPHLSLLRVEFSFDHKLDDAFQIDLKKSQIYLNESLRKWILDFLTAPRRAAEQQYRKGTNDSIYSNSQEVHDSSNENIKSKAADIINSRLEEINKETGTVSVINPQGKYILKLKILDSRKPGEIYVRPVSDMQDGMLWEPSIIDNGNQAVCINTGHPYYAKVYMPNHNNSVTIEGLDSLLWALSAAELETVNDNTKRHFEEMRVVVSRILRRLVEELPEPDLDK